jgi:hypothetical protein
MSGNAMKDACIKLKAFGSKRLPQCRIVQTGDIIFDEGIVTGGEKLSSCWMKSNRVSPNDYLCPRRLVYNPLHKLG